MPTLSGLHMRGIRVRGVARAAFVALAAVLATILIASPAVAGTKVWVVDRDEIQCPHADFASIQEAVTAASDGDRINVCPGRYSESVRVEKSVTLHGDPDAIAAMDCFDPAPSTLDDIDPARVPILDGRGTSGQELLSLAADDVVVAGFVLQGAAQDPLPSDYHAYRRAVDTDERYSGYRVRHNYIRLNTVGVQFGSSGARRSRADHNCLRLNTWGLATDDRAVGSPQRPLFNARVDHNQTYRTRFYAFEPALGEIGDVSFDHNHSRQDDTAFLIRNSTSSRIVDNTIESARFGIQVGGGLPNRGLDISRNVISNPFGGNVLQGLVLAAAPAGRQPNSQLTVTDNVITGMRGTINAAIGDGIVAAGTPNTPTASVMDSYFSGNVTSGNHRDGFVVRGGNVDNVFRENVAEGNGRYGIYAAGATRNSFESNRMLNNADKDARDDAWGANTWTGNLCVSDLAVLSGGTITGVICGAGN